jgi:hypothetical protein
MDRSRHTIARVGIAHLLIRATLRVIIGVT